MQKSDGQKLFSIVAEKVAKVISFRDDWYGHFTVIEEDKIRMRDLTVRSPIFRSSKGLRAPPPGSPISGNTRVGCDCRVLRVGK